MSAGNLLLGALHRALEDGGFGMALVSNGQGLPLACVGPEDAVGDGAAALTALFDDVAVRAERDLGLRGLDELSLRQDGGARLVVRPFDGSAAERLFVVVTVPEGRPWRRATNRLVRELRVGFAEDADRS